MKKLNNKGSTITTCIIIVMILLIIVGSALMIATNYQQRSINEHARKQAYLNGVSVADTISGQFNGENSSSFIPTGTTPVVISNVALPDTTENDTTVSHGGSVSAVIRMDESDENLIYIQVTSTYNQQTEEVQLTMQRYRNVWYRKVYSKIGETFSDESQ